MSKVVVFGVFDRFHKGHYEFLKQSAIHGELIVVVTRDSIVKRLKKKEPWQTESVRMDTIHTLGYDAVLGDETMGEYTVLRVNDIGTVCLGYDQIGLRNDLESRICNGLVSNVQLRVMKEYEAHIYHTSILYPRA